MSDALIIGGGIAGLSAARALAAHCDVTLLETEAALGTHASGRSAALYEANYGKPSTIALNEASLAHHQGAGVLSDRGLLLIGAAESAEAFKSDVASMKLSEISVEDACTLFPILDASVIDRAAHDPHAWDIDTDLLLQGYAKDARQHGAKIVTNAPVTSIERDGKGWTVLAAGQTYQAKILVNAAGAWADSVAEMAGIAPLGLTPLRRSMARIPAPEGHDVDRWPMLFGPGEDWYAKPDAGALLVSPADEDPMPPMDAWADDMVLAEGLARFEAHVTTPVTRMLANWAGLRTFAPDRELVLGRATQDPEFVWCAGQGGYGMQSSPAAGEHIADIVLGRMPQIGADIAQRLDPARFD